MHFLVFQSYAQFLSAVPSKIGQGMSKESKKEYRCRACGKQFKVLGDLQKHILIMHHQKGDIPGEAEAG